MEKTIYLYVQPRKVTKTQSFLRSHVLITNILIYICVRFACEEVAMLCHLICAVKKALVEFELEQSGFTPTNHQK